MRPRAERCDEPAAPCEPESGTSHSMWSVVVGELDMVIERVPLSLPAPHCTAVNTAAVGDGLQGKLLNDEQLHRKSSRFREVRVGRIGHGRLLSV